jgi:hypothetical protein
VYHTYLIRYIQERERERERHLTKSKIQRENYEIKTARPYEGQLVELPAHIKFYNLNPNHNYKLNKYSAYEIHTFSALIKLIKSKAVPLSPSRC